MSLAIDLNLKRRLGSFFRPSYNHEMRALLILLIILTSSACGNMNTLNGVSSDQQRFSDEGSSQFLAAKAVLINQCVSCHSFSTFSEQEWLSSGMIVPQSTTNSSLFKRLKNNGLAGSAQDMPPSGQLSPEEVGLIADWINSL